MTKIDKKAAQDFFCAVSKDVDRVKPVALWSAKKNKKDHKGLRFHSYCNSSYHYISVDLLTAVRIEVKILERGFIENLA
jgi:hypothetical protein